MILGCSGQAAAPASLIILRAIERFSAIVAVLASLCLLAFPGSSAAEPSNSPTEAFAVPSMPPVITGGWRGWYYYADGRPPVEFEFQFRDVEGVCRGNSREGNTFGSESASTLSATLQCDSLRLAPGQKIVILKRYDGTGRITHAVRYVGTVWPDLQQITGQWEIGMTRGRFVIRR
jgi:hypothetical protein